jgi:putative ABC transport system permease protein
VHAGSEISGAAVTSLQRKLVRDLWHLRGQVVAIALVVACGVAAVVATRTAYESLSTSQATYYAEYRFADVFANLKRAPEWVAARIARIPGVVRVETRIVFDVTLDLPGRIDPAVGRLISVPERRQPILNDLHLRRGRWIEPGRRDEVIASEAFVNANRLDLGDRVGAILNGRWQELRIVGVALSPEYVYEIRGTDLFPNNRNFGVFWMSRDALGPAFDMDRAFNDVVLRLAPDAGRDEVLSRLDRVLEPYGGLGAIDRDDQISNRFVSDEIRQNEVTGNVVPLIFLGVAAFLLNIVLTRLIGVQRDQIGVLKAFGYGRWAVSLHYLEFALVATLAGTLLGLAVGVWLGERILDLYVEFYRFPVYQKAQSARVLLLPIALSLGAALVGALGAVRRAFALPAAEAMRPEAPPRFRRGWLERLGAKGTLSLPARMILRNLGRRPLRAALSILGIALAVSILVMGRFFIDAVDYIADVQFRLVQREDVAVLSQNPLPAGARYEFARLPGVMRGEAFRVVPVRLRSAHRSYRAGLMGLPPGGELRQLIGRDLKPVALPPEGVVLTSRLAENLGVRPGDTLDVEVLEGARPRRSVRVSGLVDELLGLSAYMDAGALHRLVQEGGTVSGALLRVDETRLRDLHTRLKRLPAVAGVTMRSDALAALEETMGENLAIFTGILVVFACVIAFAVVYNAARIALSERGRELASLRVLGFTRREVTVLLLGEQALLLLAAVPLGFAIGRWVCGLMSAAYQTDLFRIPLYLSPQTYAFAVVVVLAAAVLSAWIVTARVARLDLVAVLKTRE